MDPAACWVNHLAAVDCITWLRKASKSAYLSASLSVCLSIVLLKCVCCEEMEETTCPSACLSAFLSVSLTVCWSAELLGSCKEGRMETNVCLSLCQPVLCVCLSIGLLNYLTVARREGWRQVSVCMPVCLSVYLTECLFVCYAAWLLWGEKERDKWIIRSFIFSRVSLVAWPQSVHPPLSLQTGVQRCETELDGGAQESVTRLGDRYDWDLCSCLPSHIEASLSKTMAVSWY